MCKYGAAIIVTTILLGALLTAGLIGEEDIITLLKNLEALISNLYQQITQKL